MAHQFENPNIDKPQDEAPAPTQQKKLDRIAEEAAEKAAKVEKRYDSEHNIISK